MRQLIIRHSIAEHLKNLDFYMISIKATSTVSAHSEHLQSKSMKRSDIVVCPLDTVSNDVCRVYATLPMHGYNVEKSYLRDINAGGSAMFVRTSQF